jgi:hypothetical protein
VSEPNDQAPLEPWIRGEVPSAVTFPIDWSAGPCTSKYSIEDGYAFECRVGGIVHVGHTLAEAIGKSIGSLRDTAWPAIQEAARQAEQAGQRPRLVSVPPESETR